MKTSQRQITLQFTQTHSNGPKYDYVSMYCMYLDTYMQTWKYVLSMERPVNFVSSLRL